MRRERTGGYSLEEEDLTHYGRSIGDMERFDEIQLSEGDGQEEGTVPQ